MRRAFVGMLVVGALSFAGAAPSSATPSGRDLVGIEQGDKKATTTANVEVLVLHGTNDGKGIDPGIGKMPELEKPPFSSYNSYALLERSTVELTKATAKDHGLPDGGKLTMTLKDVVKKGDGPNKYFIVSTIEKPGGKVFLPALEINTDKGKYFFIAGQKYKGGILVIGIRVT